MLEDLKETVTLDHQIQGIVGLESSPLRENDLRSRTRVSESPSCKPGGNRGFAGLPRNGLNHILMRASPGNCARRVL